MLENNVILVTNVTHFVGAPLCRVAVEDGALVVAQDPKFADDAEREVFAREHPSVTLTAEKNPRALVELVVNTHGRIDGLVPNDGFPAIRAAVEEADPQDMRNGLEEMVLEPFELVGAAVPKMKKQGGGRIVIPTSAAPYHGLPNYSMYVTGRGAQHFMIKTLAKELAKSNIFVNGAGGNFIESPSYFSEEVLSNPEVRAKIESQIPLKRLGSPKEFADVVAFLLSDKAGFVTGHVIPVAGGWA